MSLPIPSTKPDMQIDEKTVGDFFDLNVPEDDNLLETGLWADEEDDDESGE